PSTIAVSPGLTSYSRTVPSWLFTMTEWSVLPITRAERTSLLVTVCATAAPAAHISTARTTTNVNRETLMGISFFDSGDQTIHRIRESSELVGRSLLRMFGVGHRAHDVPEGRAADVVERVAGHEGDRRIDGRVEDRDLLRGHDSNGLDPVGRPGPQGLE